MFSIDFIRDNFAFILSALPITLLITFLSLIFSTLSGAILAWVMIRNVPYVKYLVTVFISFGRSIPMLVMLYFTSGRGLPTGFLVGRRIPRSATNSRRWWPP